MKIRPRNTKNSKGKVADKVVTKKVFLPDKKQTDQNNEEEERGEERINDFRPCRVKVRRQKRLLPDQKKEEEEVDEGLYYDFRACRVKVRRLNPPLLPNNQQTKEEEEVDANTLLPDQQKPEEEVDEGLYYDFRACRVKVRRLKSLEKIIENKEEPSVSSNTLSRKETLKNTKDQADPKNSLNEESHLDFAPCCVKVKRLKFNNNIPEVNSKNCMNNEADHISLDETSIRNLVNKTKVFTQDSSESLKENAITISEEIPDHSKLSHSHSGEDNEINMENKNTNINLTERNTTRHLRSRIEKSRGDRSQNKSNIEAVPAKSANQISALNQNESSAFVLNQESSNSTEAPIEMTTSSKRHSIRIHPSLSLTKRRAEELRLQKSLLSGKDRTDHNEFIEINNSTQFEPSRNSTMHNHPLNADVHSNEQSQKTNNQSKRHSLRSAATKILNPPTQQLENNKNDGKSNDTVYSKKSNKRDAPPMKKNPAHRRRKTKMSTVCENSPPTGKRDIYEFLSLSQDSDSDTNKHKDPAADIIKKLIEEGKVVVTKNRNGKPHVVARRKKKNPALKKYENLLKKPKGGGAALKLRNQFKPTAIDEALIEEDEPSEPSQREPNLLLDDDALMRKKRDRKMNVPAEQGTFSILARSALMQHTNEQHLVRKSTFDKKRLLEITQRHVVSTPLQKSRTSLPAPVPVCHDLSPITKSPITNDTNKSFRNPPTRAINFEHDASYIPSLPPHEITDADAEIQMKEMPSSSSSLNKSIANNISQKSAAEKQNSLSSFSSNDSNAENMPPPPPPPPPPAQSRMNESTERNDENAIVFNARQTLNPLRTFAKRSPLKAINIIDVVTLPPYTGPIVPDKIPENSKSNQNNNKNTQEISNEDDANNSFNEFHELSAIDETSNENGGGGNNSNDESKCVNEESAQALFGFEEYLKDDQKNNLDNNETETNNNSSNSSVANLRKHLKKLKKWRPKKSMLRYNDAKSSTITKNIFDDNLSRTRGGGQRDIRNLLCSTMINASSSNKTQNTTAISLLNSSSSDDDSDNVLSTTSRKNNDVDLFGDPESTFNQEALHRTYERPFKRKRKLLHPYSVLFDSEDENSDEDAHNTSVVTTKNAKRPKKHHRNQHEASPNPELEKFVTDFNSMLKEAEEYELVVE